MMTVTLERHAMAKANGRPKKPGGEGAQVRIDADPASMARLPGGAEGRPAERIPQRHPATGDREGHEEGGPEAHRGRGGMRRAGRQRDHGWRW